MRSRHPGLVTLLASCCYLPAASRLTSFATPVALSSRSRLLCHRSFRQDPTTCAGSSKCRRAVMLSSRAIMMGRDAVGRDRGQKGEQRRDIRVFVDSQGGLSVGSTVELTEDQARYLRKVMRVRDGCEFKVFDGESGEFWCYLEESSKQRGPAVGIVSEMRKEMAKPEDVWLLVANLKSNMDLVVQKATELGVSRVQPLLTQRTASPKMKLERLRTVAIEASEQCERLSVPEICEAVLLSDLILQWPQDRKLILCDETGGKPLLSVLQQMQPDTPCAFAIGPEGGFTPEEFELLRNLPSCDRASLGPNILRAETAAIAVLACHHVLKTPLPSP